MKSLSQLGLLRVPANPNQRIHDPVPAKRTTLDAFNDRQKTHHLHPTKGWRKMSVKRSLIALVTAERKVGHRYELAGLRAALRGAA